MRLCCLLLFLMLALPGCAAVPFHRAEPVSQVGLEPGALLAKYRESAPEIFNQLNSIVFDFAGQKVLAIGFLEINSKEKSFRVVCLNPMGVKLFDLSGDEAGLTTNYAIEPLAKLGDIAVLVAADIRRIYFDNAPKENATPYGWGNRVIFGGGTPDGYLEHVFAGGTGDLVEKRFYADQLLVWQVDYSEYHENNGRRYPREITIIDYKNGYQLTVREKEQSLEQD